MSKDKVSSQELVEQVANKLSVSKRVAEEFLKSLFAEIEDALIKGESVKVKNLGTFKLQWNEPRKSVNVQTGEVILLDGYNKVTFTPDSDLKDAVNKPYAHLETVELDNQNDVMTEDTNKEPEVTEPLRNLSEQASEIKNLLSEINSLSPKKELRAEQPTKRYEIPDYDLILLDEDLNEDDNAEEDDTDEEPETTLSVSAPEPSAEESEIITEEKSAIYEADEITASETKEVLTHTKPEEEEAVAEPEEKEVETAPVPVTAVTESTPYKTPIAYSRRTTDLSETVTNPFILKKRKKRKALRPLFWIFLLIALTVGGFYVALTTSSCFSCWVKYTLLSEENKEMVYSYVSQAKDWISGKPKASEKTAENKTAVTPVLLTDSVATNAVTDSASRTSQPVDSFQVAFDHRRNYNVFIGEEKISEGYRLTNISQKYYGKKDFWVYIYEANRDNIVHPDRITPGTVIKIPKVNPLLIDKKNPRCLEKARELHDLYVGKK